MLHKKKKLYEPSHTHADEYDVLKECLWVSLIACSQRHRMVADPGCDSWQEIIDPTHRCRGFCSHVPQ